MREEAHYQNCLSGKDIMMKTTQPFFTSSYNIMKHFLKVSQKILKVICRRLVTLYMRLSAI